MKVASTKLTNPEWEAVQDRCNSNGVTIAEFLRQLIRDEIGGEKDSKRPAIEKPKTLFGMQSNQKRKITKAEYLERDVEDDEEDDYPPSTLPEPTLALRQEMASQMAAILETTKQVADMKKAVEDLKRLQQVRSTAPSKMGCIIPARIDCSGSRWHNSD